MTADDALYGIRHHSPDECREAVRSAEVGRLGMVLDGDPEIFPVNYAVNRGTIVFRTAEGTKLDGALPGHRVVFEVDGFNPDTNQAWSAVIKGTTDRPRTIEGVLETAALPTTSPSPPRRSPDGGSTSKPEPAAAGRSAKSR